MQTLTQIVRQSPAGSLPLLTIEDWPDFPHRGVYYDVTRGRVPELARLKELADLLSRHKINELQLYIEHTFHFRRHPEIGKNASPLTAEDILALDAYCRERHIELVPSLASFSHLNTVLNLPEYRHLAEDCGELQYADPEAKQYERGRGRTLAAANEESYIFLRQLFDEYLPCFSSPRFNVCCDESFDFGWGQSYDLAQRLGKGRLYLNHLIRLREMAAAHGKKIMFWGDIIRHYPELIPEIPSDVTVLDWAYDVRVQFDRIQDFTSTGLPSYCCPSVNGYGGLFPRMHEATVNIAGWAQAGREHGAIGMLNTDWGDGGHYNFMECTWPGYLFGAEQSWNADADIPSFYRRFAKLFLGIDDPDFAQALITLGDITLMAVRGFANSVWQHVYFAAPADVREIGERLVWVSDGGQNIREISMQIDAALGRSTYEKLVTIKQIFQRQALQPDVDPHGVLDYWLFAVDTLLQAARKLAMLGKGGEDTPPNRQALYEEMGALRERFIALWHARNRPSEINITLAQYQHALNGLASTAVECK